MSSTNKILPNILKALSAAPENQDNLANIVHSVAEDLKTTNASANQDEVASEVKQSLQVAADLGLIAANSDNVYRLQFNTSAKLPFAIQNLEGPSRAAPSEARRSRNLKKKSSNRRRYTVDVVNKSDSAISLDDDLSEEGMLRARTSSRRMKRTRSSSRSKMRSSKRTRSGRSRRRRRRTRF